MGNYFNGFDAGIQFAGSAFTKGGNPLAVSYDSSSGVSRVDTATEIYFQFPVGDVSDDGNGKVTVVGSGSGGTVTIVPDAPINGGGTGSTLHVGLNYDTTDSFNPSSANLSLMPISVSTPGVGLMNRITVDGFGRVTAWNRITINSDSFDSSVTSTQLRLKPIAVTVPSWPGVITAMTVDSSGRVTDYTRKFMGMFRITSAARTAGAVYWTYTLDSVTRITSWPFFANDSVYSVQGYNLLETANSASYVYGLDVASTAGTGDISLGGSYNGFSYSSAPTGLIVRVWEERYSSSSTSYFFEAPNKITGSCPS
jgi:hypothetical protein